MKADTGITANRHPNNQKSITLIGKDFVKLMITATSDPLLLKGEYTQSIPIHLTKDTPYITFVVKLKGRLGVDRTIFNYDDTPFLLRATLSADNKAKVELKKGTTGGRGRIGYVDDDGNVYTFVDNSLVTSKKNCEQADLFVNDPDLLCQYINGLNREKIVDKDDILAVAEKTAQEISEAEKTAARIKELEAELDDAGIKYRRLCNILDTSYPLFSKGISYHKIKKWVTENADQSPVSPWERNTLTIIKRYIKVFGERDDWKKSAIAMREAQEKKWVWQRASARTEALSNFPDAPELKDLTSGHRNMKHN